MLVLLMGLPVFGFGQSVDSTLCSCVLNSKSRIGEEAIISQLNSLDFGDSIEVKVEQLYQRDIVDGFRESFITIIFMRDEGYWTNHLDYIDVCQITDAGGNPVYKTLRRKKSVWSGHGVRASNLYRSICADSVKSKLKQLNDAFMETFGSNLDIDEMFNQELPFGNSCEVRSPLGREKLDQFVQDQSVDSLESWLSSSNFNKRLYAYEGLKKLKIDRVSGLGNYEKAFTQIKSSEGQVQLLWNCMRHTYPSITEVLLYIQSELNAYSLGKD